MRRLQLVNAMCMFVETESLYLSQLEAIVKHFIEPLKTGVAATRTPAATATSTAAPVAPAGAPLSTYDNNDDGGGGGGGGGASATQSLRNSLSFRMSSSSSSSKSSSSSSSPSSPLKTAVADAGAAVPPLPTAAPPPVLSENKLVVLFSNVDLLYSMHATMFAELSHSTPDTFLTVMNQFVPFLRMYRTFLGNYERSKEMLDRLMRKNREVRSATVAM
jgi:hypothetical protein